MNLAWVALLAVAVLIEKAVPGGQQIAWLAGIAAVAVGVAMVLGLSPVAIRVAG
jgi:predicted metal-binding membrane protein